MNWNWHGRQSWGRRAVAAFPIVGILVAVALFVHTTASAQGAIDQVQSVVGTGGATLLSGAPPTAAGGSAGGGQLSDYQNVTFSQPSGPSTADPGQHLPGPAPLCGLGGQRQCRGGQRAGLASAGACSTSASAGPTPDFRGWFLTTTGTTPATCAFQFSAASPPPVDLRVPEAIGELVMAVQTSDTVTTGDINYVFVAENVASGRSPEPHRGLLPGTPQPRHRAHLEAGAVEAGATARRHPDQRRQLARGLGQRRALLLRRPPPARDHPTVPALPRGPGPPDPLHRRLRRVLERVPDPTWS